MTFEQRRSLLLRTGDFLTQFVNGNLYGDKYSIELLDLVERASVINPFFTVNEVMHFGQLLFALAKVRWIPG